jgi:hypothetical protein
MQTGRIQPAYFGLAQPLWAGGPAQWNRARALGQRRCGGGLLGFGSSAAGSVKEWRYGGSAMRRCAVGRRGTIVGVGSGGGGR